MTGKKAKKTPIKSTLMGFIKVRRNDVRRKVVKGRR
jgi:hypothetical protein